MRNMKDSGIEWIGEIPEDWEIRKLSSIANTITDFVASGSFASLNENVKYLDIPDYAMLVRAVDLSNKSNIKPIYINKHAYNFLSNSNLFGGEIILPNIGSVGDVYMYKPLYTYSSLAPNSIMLRMKDSNKFYYYWFLNPSTNDTLKRIGSDSIQKKFNKTQLRQLLAVKPPIEEQEIIADYLDSKVSQIDNIISKTKETIEEYKKYKQSVIIEVVTKGLNPNVEMKDSGIEWIGNIPDHWKIRKGKYILELLSRTILENDEVITCFRDGEVTLRSNRREDGFTFADKEIGYQGVEPNDLVIHSMDGFAGAIGISDSRGKASPVVLVCDSYQNKEYIMYYLRSMAYNEVFTALATGIRVRSCDLRWNKIGNLLYPIPSIKEQEEIVTYIKDICIQIDKMISIKQELLLELEQYKKSLIYECVTGKKEVSPAYAN